MKVIELLNRIANGEEVPRKFRFARQIFEKQGSRIEDKDGDSIIDSIFYDFSNLNDEIEIIEEDKKIEKMTASSTNSFNQALVDKINEIIDVINRGD